MISSTSVTENKRTPPPIPRVPNTKSPLHLLDFIPVNPSKGKGRSAEGGKEHSIPGLYNCGQVAGLDWSLP